MKKKTNKNLPNNSKQISKKVEDPLKKITSETIVLLSVYDDGIIIKQPNAGNKSEIRKIKISPFWDHRRFKKPPKNYYESNKSYNEPKVSSITIKTKINSTAVNYFISDDGKPYQFKGNWKYLSKIKRLEENLKIFANGRNFDYQIIE